MRLAGQLLANLLILTHPAFSKDRVLKPDREISITSLEHREDRPPNKSYTVEGKTSGSPTLYYKLSCGTAAADLEVGHRYKAAEVTIEEKKALVIWTENHSDDPNIFGLGCDVESVKDH